jgi:NAD-dependent deacetylase
LNLFEKAKPTKGHKFLNKLETLGKLKAVITQNIDGLHKKAGNSNIIELHGNFEKFYCIECYDEIYSESPLYKKVLSIIKSKKVPRCQKCNGIIKPNIVFFGEYVRDLEKALTEIQKADLMITMGTSLTVYPASTLPSYLSDTLKYYKNNILQYKNN